MSIAQVGTLACAIPFAHGEHGAAYVRGVAVIRQDAKTSARARSRFVVVGRGHA